MSPELSNEIADILSFQDNLMVIQGFKEYGREF